MQDHLVGAPIRVIQADGPVTCEANEILASVFVQVAALLMEQNVHRHPPSAFASESHDALDVRTCGKRHQALRA